MSRGPLERRSSLLTFFPVASLRVNEGSLEPGWIAFEGSKEATISDFALRIGPVISAGKLLNFSLTAVSCGARDMVAAVRCVTDTGEFVGDYYRALSRVFIVRFGF